MMGKGNANWRGHWQLCTVKNGSLDAKTCRRRGGTPSLHLGCHRRKAVPEVSSMDL